MRQNFRPQGIHGLINTVVLHVRSPNKQHHQQQPWELVRSTDFSGPFPDLLKCTCWGEAQWSMVSQALQVLLVFPRIWGPPEVWGNGKLATNNILLYIQNDDKITGYFHVGELQSCRMPRFQKYLSFRCMTEKYRPSSNFTWLIEIPTKI